MGALGSQKVSLAPNDFQQQRQISIPNCCFQPFRMSHEKRSFDDKALTIYAVPFDFCKGTLLVTRFLGSLMDDRFPWLSSPGVVFRLTVWFFRPGWSLYEFPSL